jgi:hypothetical protein
MTAMNVVPMRPTRGAVVPAIQWLEAIESIGRTNADMMIRLTLVWPRVMLRIWS